MAVDSSARKVVLAFRGTVSLAQAIAELLHHRLVSMPGHPEALVNEYFLKATASLKEDIDQTLVNLWNTTCQGCQLWVTGHSLGGAMGMLTAARISDRTFGLGHTPIVYTFGQPRVGNAAFADLVTQYLPEHYRLVNADDAVPHMPLCDTGTTFSAAPCTRTRTGYFHAGQEMWFPRGEYQNGVMCGYRECVGEPLHEDWSCSDGQISDLHPGSITDHHHYWDVLDHNGYCKPLLHSSIVVV